jgi:hypothetical protein
VPENSIKLCIKYSAKADGESKEYIQNLSRKTHGNWPATQENIRNHKKVVRMAG